MDGQKSFRILGVDPGLNTTGYAVIQIAKGAPEVIEAGLIRAPAGASLSRKLLVMHEGLSQVIAGLGPAAVALEELYSHYDRPRTAILMGHARGVICLAASQAGLATHHYAATQIKKMLTGNGRAPKIQMQRAVQRELRLDRLPQPADVADALAVALCHHYLAPRAVAWETLSRAARHARHTG